MIAVKNEKIKYVMISILKRKSKKTDQTNPLRQEILDILPPVGDEDRTFTPTKIFAELDEKYPLNEIRNELEKMFNQGCVTQCDMSGDEKSYTL
jgi:hypothetical protein